jgi:hypothetical protein
MSGLQFNFFTVSTTPFAKKIALSSLSGKRFPPTA